MADDRSEQVSAHADDCTICSAVLEKLDNQQDQLVLSLRGAKSGPVVAPAPASSPEALSSRVGAYEILGELGRGGMGVVYRARHSPLNRIVALKMLLDGTFADMNRRARFLAEAKAVARLQHPHIVQIYEVGEHVGAEGAAHPYFTLEFASGGNLADLLQGRPLLPEQGARWAAALAGALHYAHEQGIVHRDLKPANILLQGSEGTSPNSAAPIGSPVGCESSHLIPKLADFGIAKWLTGSEVQTQTGFLLGTPEYMAPEQAAGAHGVGPAADIYALGAVLYHMLTGGPPFRGVGALQTVTLLQTTDPMPPRRLQPGVPRDLDTICLKCLQKDPARRYRTAGELAEDLGRFGRREPILARPVPVWRRAGMWAARRPAHAALVAMAALVVLIGLPGTTWLWLRADRERASKETALNLADRARLGLEDETYAAHIALAASALESNDVFATQAELEKCRFAADRRDLRGWEWYYLLRQCHTDLVPGLAHHEAGAIPHAVGFLPDARRMFSAGGLVLGLPHAPGHGVEAVPGQLKIWDAQTGLLIGQFQDHRGAVCAAVVSADGHWLASAGADGTVAIRDAATLAPVPGPPPGGPGWQALAFAPNGQTLAIASGARVLLWDLVARRTNCCLAAPASSLAFSHDGRRLMTAAPTDEPPVLWDLAARQPISHRITEGRINALAFSPDGHFLAVSHGNDPRIHVWDASGSRLLYQLIGHSHAVRCLAFAANNRLASGGEDRIVCIHDLPIGQPTAVLRGHRQSVLTVAFSADGKRLLSGSVDESVKLWDLSRDPRGQGLHVVSSGLGEYIAQIAFLPDSHHLCVVDSSAGVSLGIWDLAGNTPPRRVDLKLGKGSLVLHHHFAHSADHRRLAGIDIADPRIVHLWDLSTGEQVGVVHAPTSPARALALSADGTQIACCGSEAPGEPAHPGARAALTIIDATTDRIRCSISPQPGETILCPVFSPDGRWVAAGRVAFRPVRDADQPHEAKVGLWNALTGEAAPDFEDGHFGYLRGLAFSPDGAALASVGFEGTDGRLLVHETATGRLRFPALKTASFQTGVTFSPDGRRVAVNGYDGLVRLWDAASGKQVLTLRGFEIPGNGNYAFTGRVLFSPDGSRLAASSWHWTVNVWDSGKCTSP